MYLKMPKKCALADQLQRIRPNTASMLAIWQILFVCLTGSLTTDARSNLFPGAPAGYHGCKEPIPMQPSALNACYYNHYKISAIQDTMKTS